MKKALFCLLASCMLFAMAACDDKTDNATDYYQIAVDNGYTGTKAQFVEDISSLGIELGSGVKEVKREGNSLIITLHDGTVFEVDLTASDGEDGKDGKMPYIGENGNWWIDGEDTGVVAENKTEYTVYLNEDYSKFDTKIKVKKGNCIELPTGITEIADTTFLNCKKLIEVRGLERVISIGKSAFSGCELLLAGDLTALQRIGEHAFYNCISINRVIFSNEVLFEGEMIFGGWTENQNICFEVLENPLEGWHEDWYKNSQAALVWNYTKEA